MATRMLGSKSVGSGTSPLIKVKTSIRQDPAFEIQILPAEEAWCSSWAVGVPGHEGGRATVRELDSVRVKFGVFPATLMVPRSIEAAGIAPASKSRAWQ